VYLERLQKAVRQNNFVVLDTETTGLDRRAQVCQVAIIDGEGKTLVDRLVKPTRPIPLDATRIHGITNAHVADAPGFGEVAPQIVSAISGRAVIIYNATFDLAMLRQSAEAVDVQIDWPGLASYVCAMQAYAQHWGVWDAGRRSYRWQSLSAACSQQTIPVKNAHNALGDCLLTLALIKKISAPEE
jgi:DNA polymerase-3 subunit epsilon